MDEQQRIAVIGSPGGGKSTLATAIAHATGLPLAHLDRLYWRAGWIEADRAAWRAENVKLVATDQWVIDGNYGSTLATRLQRATLVIWIDLPTSTCLTGALRRAWRYRRGGRPDMADDCPERLDWAFLAFLRYIATFRRRRRAVIAAALAASGVPLVQLTSTAQRAAFLRQVAAGGLATATASPD
ncbi:topology modulation protein [Sphingomonas sp.]|uniref:topology modulation protein n=1 Tax=Sphingomonas sp. TaxID=28214 RepID=UPI003CC5F154